MKHNQIFSLVLILMAMVGADFNVFGSDGKPSSGMLTGKVLDAATGEELTGARITIKGSEAVTYSEADGSFAIDLRGVENRPESFELVVTLVSFESAVIRISSDGITNPAVIVLNER